MVDLVVLEPFEGSHRLVAAGLIISSGAGVMMYASLEKGLENRTGNEASSLPKLDGLI
ncbi:hypothetical protein HS088_TW14G00999 [Tripterygium wilfordii]|uniref:Uncharacterized protein n=1 Tax=Tripterygium wilfordii TaxID=458696 RepID=A0A7J7CS17_TRIWF|nr:hypothetical protein HS088_TW14G00999 [Tripterygium wilfordii]